MLLQINSCVSVVVVVVVVVVAVAFAFAAKLIKPLRINILYIKIVFFLNLSVELAGEAIREIHLGEGPIDKIT